MKDIHVNTTIVHSTVAGLFSIMQLHVQRSSVEQYLSTAAVSPLEHETALKDVQTIGRCVASCT